jgi:phosphoserine phosphatase RsbX
VTHIRVAAAARAYPGEPVSGDDWRVDRDGDRYRIAVIDGLGHGAQAAVAAQAAIDVLGANPRLDPGAVLAQCHLALRTTRGAAMGVALIDLGAQRLTFAGVGNVETLFLTPSEKKRLGSARGIVGSVLPRIIPVEVALEDGWWLVLHTDGVRNRYTLVDLLADNATPQEVADAMLMNWGRSTDDATVVVAGVDDTAP